MPAKIKSIKTSNSLSKKLFYITGELIEGQINVGDQILITLNSQISMDGKIDTINNINPKNKSLITIGIKYDSKDELDIWQSMNIGNDEILNIK